MKKADVKIGVTYVAKVSGQLAPVRIVAESPFGGWEGVNVRTGHRVRIRGAQRLRREYKCPLCKAHYGDEAACDEGKPVNSPHRKAAPHG